MLVSRLLGRLGSRANRIGARLRLDNRVNRVFDRVHVLGALFRIHNLRHLNFSLLLGSGLLFSFCLGLVFSSVHLLGLRSISHHHRLRHALVVLTSRLAVLLPLYVLNVERQR